MMSTVYFPFIQNRLDDEWKIKDAAEGCAQCHRGNPSGPHRQKVRRGSVIYTDKFRRYDSLMFCGYRHLKVDHGKYFSSGKVYINGMEGFWSWAKEHFIKHHGVSKEYFPLYLKELEFRYNNRNSDIFDLIQILHPASIPGRTMLG